jgi:hypothetical protein
MNVKHSPPVGLYDSITNDPTLYREFQIRRSRIEADRQKGHYKCDEKNSATAAGFDVAANLRIAAESIDIASWVSSTPAKTIAEDYLGRQKFPQRAAHAT